MRIPLLLYQNKAGNQMGRIRAIKTVRLLTDWGLKAAKDYIDEWAPFEANLLYENDKDKSDVFDIPVDLKTLNEFGASRDYAGVVAELKFRKLSLELAQQAKTPNSWIMFAKDDLELVIKDATIEELALLYQHDPAQIVWFKLNGITNYSIP